MERLEKYKKMPKSREKGISCGLQGEEKTLALFLFCVEGAGMGIEAEYLFTEGRRGID